MFLLMSVASLKNLLGQRALKKVVEGVRKNLPSHLKVNGTFFFLTLKLQRQSWMGRRS